MKCWEQPRQCARELHPCNTLHTGLGSVEGARLEAPVPLLGARVPSRQLPAALAAQRLCRFRLNTPHKQLAARVLQQAVHHPVRALDSVRPLACSLQLQLLRPMPPLCTSRLHISSQHESFSRPRTTPCTGIQQVISDIVMGCNRWGIAAYRSGKCWLDGARQLAPCRLQQSATRRMRVYTSVWQQVTSRTRAGSRAAAPIWRTPAAERLTLGHARHCKGCNHSPGGHLLQQRLVAVPQQAPEAGLQLGHAARGALAQPPQQRRARQARSARLVRHRMHLGQQHLHLPGHASCAGIRKSGAPGSSLCCSGDCPRSAGLVRHRMHLGQQRVCRGTRHAPASGQVERLGAACHRMHAMRQKMHL